MEMIIETHYLIGVLWRINELMYIEHLEHWHISAIEVLAIFSILHQYSIPLFIRYPQCWVVLLLRAVKGKCLSGKGTV